MALEVVNMNAPDSLVWPCPICHQSGDDSDADWSNFRYKSYLRNGKIEESATFRTRDGSDKVASFACRANPKHQESDETIHDPEFPWPLAEG